MTSPDPTEGAAAQAAASHREERIGLGPDRSGKDHSVRIVRFGAPGARPKAYIQAGLHADELKGNWSRAGWWRPWPPPPRAAK